MSKRPLAIIDVDDVILDWTNGFNDWIISNKGYNGQRLYTLKQSLEQLNAVDWAIEFNNSPEFSELEFIDGAIEGINEIFNIGFDIILLTSCGQEVYESRKTNLSKLQSPFTLICLNFAEKKDNKIHELKPNLFIDDNIHNARVASAYGMSLHMQTGFNNPAEIQIVKSWEEITKKIKKNF